MGFRKAAHSVPRERSPIAAVPGANPVEEARGGARGLGRQQIRIAVSASPRGLGRENLTTAFRASRGVPKPLDSRRALLVEGDSVLSSLPAGTLVTRFLSRQLVFGGHRGKELRTNGRAG